MRDFGHLGDVFAVLGDRPKYSDSGPLSLSDPAVIDRVLTGAGFTDVKAEAVDADQVWGRDIADATDFIMGWGPVRFALRDVSPPAVDELREAAARSSARATSWYSPGSTGARRRRWRCRRATSRRW
ncbi:hypothetical protein ALI22I_44025 [Saccharothrix sp. ALI-22-I]|uniref:hypothetical protein n=1 Tax=Saccharothrix sp. ALI-22-I TaxID=1933778 RepID=UPI00097BFB0C|nr:hypothetical protein [Saccharothrix sp. ALI-22-I]ONI80323.1 hypothetical protein ALI22I_44025 [Saccharothrix sp. ALI-22-I]